MKTITILLLVFVLWTHFVPQIEHINWYKGSSFIGCTLISDKDYYQGEMKVRFDWVTLRVEPYTACKK